MFFPSHIIQPIVDQIIADLDISEYFLNGPTKQAYEGPLNLSVNQEIVLIFVGKPTDIYNKIFEVQVRTNHKHIIDSGKFGSKIRFDYQHGDNVVPVTIYCADNIIRANYIQRYQSWSEPYRTALTAYAFAFIDEQPVYSKTRTVNDTYRLLPHIFKKQRVSEPTILSSGKTLTHSNMIYQTYDMNEVNEILNFPIYVTGFHQGSTIDGLNILFGIIKTNFNSHQKTNFKVFFYKRIENFHVIEGTVVEVLRNRAIYLTSHL